MAPSAAVVPLMTVGASFTAVTVSLSALAALTPVEMAFQVVPSVDHCHVPCAAEAAFAEIAIPANASADEPPATASAASEKCPPNVAEIVAPDGLAASSLMVARDSVA